MKSKKKGKLKEPEIILGIVGLLLLILAGYLIFQNRQNKQTEEVEQPVHKARGGPCPGETRTLTQSDPYMRGIIERGQKFKVIMNYYDCNEPKRGDIVLYSLSAQLDPVTKIVKAVEGDSFKLTKDKKYHAWNLWINGKMLLTDTDKTPYFFGGNSPATLSLYENSHKGVLKKNEVILLSSWAPGDNDSGIFGLVGTVDLVGKVELLENPAENLSGGQTPENPKSVNLKNETEPKSSEIEASPSPRPSPRKKLRPKASPAPKPSPADSEPSVGGDSKNPTKTTFPDL